MPEIKKTQPGIGRVVHVHTGSEMETGGSVMFAAIVTGVHAPPNLAVQAEGEDKPDPIYGVSSIDAAVFPPGAPMIAMTNIPFDGGRGPRPDDAGYHWEWPKTGGIETVGGAKSEDVSHLQQEHSFLKDAVDDVKGVVSGIAEKVEELFGIHKELAAKVDAIPAVSDPAAEGQ